MKKTCSIVLVAVNGYGRTHANAALDYQGDIDLQIAGMVDPTVSVFSRMDEVAARGIPCFASLDEFFAAGHRADIAFIATPIHTHKTLTALAMRHGCHVYCEKPVAGNLAEALEMHEFPGAYGKWLEIGFQLSHNPTILAMKRDILAGVYGKPLRMKSIVLWPRNSAYYRRGWAGKKFAQDGVPIWDSIAANATAHYIHNMLFLLGGAINACAMPAKVQTSLWRANDIETFDACALDITTENGTQLLYYAAHCTDTLRDPEAMYEFENGSFSFCTVGGGNVVGRLHDGRVIDYGDLDAQAPVLHTIAEAFALDEPDKLTCPITAAMGHIHVMEEVNATLDTVHICPITQKRDVLQTGGETLTVYNGLAERLAAGYEAWRFVSE